MRPMVNTHEAAAVIAKELGREDDECNIWLDIADCLTDTDSEIVVAYLPDDEESLVLDYDLECQKFFQMVREATGLLWGGCFLAKIGY